MRFHVLFSLDHEVVLAGDSLMLSAIEEIARSLGERQVGGVWMTRCPAHADSTPSLAISCSSDGKMLVHCHAGCAQQAVVSALQRLGLWPASGTRFRQPVSDLGKSTANRTNGALAIWNRALRADNTPAEQFLRGRGIRLPPPERLRYAPLLKHRGGEQFPAMVGLVTRGADDKPLGVHRTYLTADGYWKAPIEPARLMLGPCSGGAIRLAAADECLMIGEGIETCLAAMQATGRAAWAALSTSGLRSLALPPSIRDLVILVDGDEPGRDAAETAARRWAREGRRVRLARAPDGMDFNDLLAEIK